LTFNKKNKNLVTLKNYDVVIRKVDLSDKPAKKIFITETVELGANQSRLAEVLGISRQTIHNYMESKRNLEQNVCWQDTILKWEIILQNSARLRKPTAYRAIRLSSLPKKEKLTA